MTQILQAEQWRAVVGYPDYEVSDLGRVRRRTSGKGARVGRVLKPLPNGTGYWQVTVHRGAIPAKRTIHGLAAAAFLGPRPAGTEVNHRDGDKANNAASNLEYVTSSANKRHAVAAGLFHRGMANPAAKLTDDQVLEIIAACRAGQPQRIVARRYRISQGHVSDLVRGKKRAGAAR